MNTIDTSLHNNTEEQYLKKENLSQNNKGMTKIFFLFWGILFTVALNFFMFNMGGSGLSLPFNCTTWIATTLVFSVGIYTIGQYRKVCYTPMTLKLFLCCLLLTIPLAFPQSNLQNSGLSFLGLWSGLLLFLGFQQYTFNEKQLKILLYIMLVGITIEVFISWDEYLFLTEHNWIGYNIKSYRPAAIFQQANITATFFSIGLALSAYLLIGCKNNIIKIWLFLMPILIVPIVVIMASRMGWVASFLIPFFVMPSLLKQNKQMAFCWAISLILGLIVGLVFVYAPELFGSTRFGSVALNKIGADSGRGQIYSQAITLWSKHIWFGVGYGNFETAFIHTMGDLYQQNLISKPGLVNLSHPHNEFLYWAIEGGIIAVIGLLLAVWFVISRIIKLPWRQALMFVALLTPIGIHLQLEYPFYHAAIHWVIFITFIYLLDRQATLAIESNLAVNLAVDNVTSIAMTKETPITDGFSLLLKLFSVITAFIVPLFLLIIMISNFYLMKYERSYPLNVDYLDKVMNLTPVIEAPNLVRSRFEWDLYTSELYVGTKLDHKDQVQSFISWAEEKRNYSPKVRYYNLLYSAYKTIGELEKAQKIWNEGHQLFPNNPKFMNQQELVTLRQKSNKSEAQTSVQTSDKNKSKDADQQVEELMKQKVEEKEKEKEKNVSSQ